MEAPNIGANLNSLSKRVFSENKKNRVEARLQLIELTKHFTEKFTLNANEYPDWTNLGSKMTYVRRNRCLPFAICQNKFGKVTKTFAIERKNPEMRLKIADGQTPAYIVTMAHCPKLSEKPNADVLNRQIELLQTESFGGDGRGIKTGQCFTSSHLYRNQSISIT